MSDSSGKTPRAELDVAVGPPGKEAETKLTVSCSAQYLGEHCWGVVVAYDEVVAGTRVERHPCMTKVSMNHPRFILLVIVDPQFDRCIAFNRTSRIEPHRSDS